MLHRRRGSIVNVSSLSAIRGLAGQTAYAATKAGLLGLTRALAREVGRTGRARERRAARLRGHRPYCLVSPEVVALLQAGGVPAPRRRPPTTSPPLVAFLLSERAAAITGQALVVDAGASA